MANAAQDAVEQLARLKLHGDRNSAGGTSSNAQRQQIDWREIAQLAETCANSLRSGELLRYSSVTLHVVLTIVRLIVPCIWEHEHCNLNRASKNGNRQWTAYLDVCRVLGS